MPVTKPSSVVVLGQKREFICYVTPGRARIMLRSGDAELFSRNPPTISLCPWSQGPPEEERAFFRTAQESVIVLDLNGTVLAPTFGAKAAGLIRDKRAILVSNQPPTIRLQRVISEQAIRRPTMEKPRYLDSSGRIVNWTEFFREERDIYVRNVTDSNISLQIGTGKDQNYVSIYRSPDPINLTAQVSFEDLKNALDFRKLANARDQKGRPLIQIMNEEEYRAYYEAKGRSLQISAEEAIRRADEERANLRRRAEERIPDANAVESKPIHTVSESGSGPGGAAHLGERNRAASLDSVREKDVVRVRLRSILFNLQQDVMEEQQNSQASGRAFDNSRITPASALLAELSAMQDLNIDELEYTRSKGYWKSIKNWATQQIENLSAVTEEGSDDLGDDLGLPV